jgi:hypothetical protein
MIAMWYARWYDEPLQWLEDHKNIMYPATIALSIILFCTIGPALLAQWGSKWLGSYPIQDVGAYHPNVLIRFLAFAGLMFTWAFQTHGFFVWGLRPWHLGRSILSIVSSLVGATILTRIFFRFVPLHSVAGAMYTAGGPLLVLLKLVIPASPFLALLFLDATLLRPYRRGR